MISHKQKKKRLIINTAHSLFSGSPFFIYFFFNLEIQSLCVTQNFSSTFSFACVTPKIENLLLLLELVFILKISKRIPVHHYHTHYSYLQ